MPRYFLHLAYDGSGYHGWQTQTPNLPTVQATLEGALARVLAVPTHLHGCGRTDAGVHARHYYAHFDAADALDGAELVTRLNRGLPADIAAYACLAVQPGAHAQRDATSRTYRYEVTRQRTPFSHATRGDYSALALDVDAMRAVTDHYARASDFRAFCRRPEQYPHTRCRVDAVRLLPIDDGRALAFEIQADRFLQQQVRLLVARMIDVGAGRLALADLETALAGGPAPRLMRPAYPQGLSLVDVGYDWTRLRLGV